MLNPSTRSIAGYLRENHNFSIVVFAVLNPQAIDEAFTHKNADRFESDLRFFQKIVCQILGKKIKDFVLKELPENIENELVRKIVDDAVKNASFYQIAKEYVTKQQLEDALLFRQN